jgi:hypothetical protein
MGYGLCHCGFLSGIYAWEEIITLWQDYALMLMGVGFSVALFPLLYSVVVHKHITNHRTAMLTAFLVAAQALTFASLGLTISAITTSGVAIMWGMICYWSYRNRVEHVLELQA